MYLYSKIVICSIITGRQQIKAMIYVITLSASNSKLKIQKLTTEKINFWMSVMIIVKGVYRYFVEVRKMLPGILFPQLSHAGQKILVVIFRHFKKKYVCNCNPYFIVIMITVLIMIGIFWVVNFKTRNYFVIFYYTERLSQVTYVRLL
jgi:preprotein translocase subunit SecE